MESYVMYLMKGMMGLEEGHLLIMAMIDWFAFPQRSPYITGYCHEIDFMASIRGNSFLLQQGTETGVDLDSLLRKCLEMLSLLKMSPPWRVVAWVLPCAATGV